MNMKRTIATLASIIIGINTIPMCSNNIYYDLESKQYDYGWDTTIHRNLIYFSSAEIVQKCCDWLNSTKSD